jgi:hypothetical protein
MNFYKTWPDDVCLNGYINDVKTRPAYIQRKLLEHTESDPAREKHARPKNNPIKGYLILWSDIICNATCVHPRFNE